MQKRTRNLVIACCVSTLGSSLGALSAPLLGESSRTAAATQPKAAPATIAHDLPTALLLPPLAHAKSALATPQQDGSQQIGIAREVAPLVSAAAISTMRWTPSAGGQAVGQLALRSADAASLRVAVALHGAPQGTTLRFLARHSGAASAQIAAQDVLDATRASGMFWGPVTAGDEQVVEVSLPTGADPAQVRMTIEGVSHLVADPALAAPVLPGEKSAAICHQDVSCVPPLPAFVQAMRSVAKIVYTVDGMTYTCTGTLVNDSEAATQVPYILTAKHCVDSAAAAATVNTYWFHEAAACGSPASGASTQLVRGARLLYAGSLNDLALLRLNEPAPAGAWFSGIDASPMAAGENAIALHHPRGDLKKVSSGRVINGAEGTSGRLISMSWLMGTTEPGSSGSGLFSERGGQYLLRGTLRGGSASCSNSGRIEDPANRDYYTRLDADIAAIGALMRAPAAPLEDYTDLWVAPEQAATGFSITQHASNATFIVWFSHDASGRPAWITMPGGTWTSARTFSGPLYRTQRPGGQVDTRPVGEATFTFVDSARGTVSYTLEGAAGTLRLERQAF